MEHVYIRREI
jgi:hypothetical protein